MDNKRYSRLYPFHRRYGSFVGMLAGVASFGWLEQHNVDFLVGYWPMLDAAWHDDHFAGAEGDMAIAQFDSQMSFHNEEQLILVFVTVPHKFALQLGQAHLLAIQFAGDLGVPIRIEGGELVAQDDLFEIYHAAIPSQDSAETGGTFPCFRPP